MGKLNTSKLSDFILRSLYKADPRNAKQLVRDALNDIQTVWERVQPEYQQSLQEISSWEKVAKQALQNNREDLARAALIKKRNYQQKAWNLEAQLNDLATMTENLIGSK